MRNQPTTFSLSTITAGLPQNLTSIGLPVVYNVTGNPLTAYVHSNGTPGSQTGAGGDRRVFASYTFTLLDQLGHGLNANDNDER